jgi:hypothetical protein
MSVEQVYPDRWTTAVAALPFGPDAQSFFEYAVNEADIFAMSTAKSGKGGPFGAALWVVSVVQGPKDEKPLVRFTFIGPQISSNAVLSTGIASNHAEAEDLSPARRRTCIRYLRRLKRSFSAESFSWKIAVVQVSSGESCSSCRARQCLFAENLYALDLLERGHFFVAFKASYERTVIDAGFNDKPYDMAFRVMLRTGVLSDALFLASADTNDQCQSDFANVKAVSVRVRVEAMAQSPAVVTKALKELCANKTRPVAIVVQQTSDGSVRVLGSAVDTRDSRTRPENQRRDADEPGLSLYEQSAITAALHRACKRRRDDGVFESWDLERAVVYTNLRHIGPLAYSEALWCNIHEFVSLAHDFGSHEVELAGRECPELNNRELFMRVAAEYNSDHSSIRVKYLGKQRNLATESEAVRRQEPSIAHIYWRATTASTVLHGVFQDFMHKGEAEKKFQVSVFPIAGPWSASPERDVQYNGAGHNRNGKL